MTHKHGLYDIPNLVALGVRKSLNKKAITAYKIPATIGQTLTNLSTLL